MYEYTDIVSFQLMNCGANFSYILNDEDTFCLTEYKIMQSQSVDCFVKCKKCLYNGKIQLYYLINGLMRLQDIVEIVSVDDLTKIIVSVLGSFINVKKNGFLSVNKIDFSTENIFIEKGTNKVFLIYLPARFSFYQSESELELKFRGNMLKCVDAVSPYCENISRAFEGLRTGASIEEVYRTAIDYKSSSGSNAVTQKEYTSGHSNTKFAKLISINSPITMEINITKNDFLIGRKQDQVDGFISFNRAIGRIHCKIIFTEEQFAVIDLESANGTYINGVRIASNKPFPIRNGDILRLANSDFQVIIF